MKAVGFFKKNPELTAIPFAGLLILGTLATARAGVIEMDSETPVFEPAELATFVGGRPESNTIDAGILERNPNEVFLVQQGTQFNIQISDNDYSAVSHLAIGTEIIPRETLAEEFAQP